MRKNKQKLLKILEIIKETDESNPVTANRIVDRLKLDGIDAERKSVLRDIDVLREYGYEIILHHDNKLGFYLGDPVFEDWELKFLADAVFSARFLTEYETGEFFKKIRGLASRTGEKKLAALVPVTFEKSKNRSVKFSINNIMTAVYEKKKIAFQYEFTNITLSKELKRNGFVYSVSPFALYRRGDQYYLIANTDGHDNLSCYRLDRMKKVEITDKPARSAESIVGKNADLAIADYIRHTLYNFGGEKITLTLEIKPCAVDDIIDFFGSEIKVRSEGDKFTAAVRTTESEGLYRWLLQFSGSVTAVSPRSVTAEMQKRIKLAANTYGITF